MYLDIGSGLIHNKMTIIPDICANIEHDHAFPDVRANEMVLTASLRVPEVIAPNPVEKYSHFANYGHAGL
jgi:hypothetical protein